MTKTIATSQIIQKFQSHMRRREMVVNEYAKLLRSLVQDARIANFEYWSEFILRIQRDDAERCQELREWFGKNRIPSLFCLRLRSKWHIGEEQEWKRSVEMFPIKGISPIPEEAPLQASLLMMLLDCDISGVHIDQDGSLTLILSDGRSLKINGKNDDWEESWFFELPVDDPDREQWLVVCDSEGNIAGKFPQANHSG